MKTCRMTCCGFVALLAAATFSGCCAADRLFSADNEPLQNESQVRRANYVGYGPVIHGTHVEHSTTATEQMIRLQTQNEQLERNIVTLENRIQDLEGESVSNGRVLSDAEQQLRLAREELVLARGQLKKWHQRLNALSANMATSQRERTVLLDDISEMLEQMTSQFESQETNSNALPKPVKVPPTESQPVEVNQMGRQSTVEISRATIRPVSFQQPASTRVDRAVQFPGGVPWNAYRN